MKPFRVGLMMDDEQRAFIEGLFAKTEGQFACTGKCINNWPACDCGKHDAFVAAGLVVEPPLG